MWGQLGLKSSSEGVVSNIRSDKNVSAPRYLVSYTNRHDCCGLHKWFTLTTVLLTLVCGWRMSLPQAALSGSTQYTNFLSLSIYCVSL